MLQTSSDKLTGTVKDGRSDTHAVSNGILDGSELRFTTDAKLNGKDVTIQWSGKWDW